jgi:hypothetical protein
MPPLAKCIATKGQRVLLNRRVTQALCTIVPNLINRPPVDRIDRKPNIVGAEMRPNQKERPTDSRLLITIENIMAALDRQQWSDQYPRIRLGKSMHYTALQSSIATLPFTFELVIIGHEV